MTLFYKTTLALTYVPDSVRLFSLFVRKGDGPTIFLPSISKLPAPPLPSPLSAIRLINLHLENNEVLLFPLCCRAAGRWRVKLGVT